MTEDDIEAPKHTYDSEALKLARDFLDEEYRRSWAEDYLNTSLALQIAVLRKQRAWKQSNLAAIAGTTQSAISRMEDIEYGAHSIRVLKQLAAAFGLRLRVSFEEFGALISESAGFSERALQRSSFHSDPEVARLLAVQGLCLPPPPNTPNTGDAEDNPEVPPVNGFLSFEDAFQAALFEPLEDRVKAFKTWLMGYGLPSPEEPAYKRLYFSIPADERHAEWARRTAAACAEWLQPERFAELLADPVDGERAVNNLLRLSAALRSAHNEILTACRQLFPWLQDEWKDLDPSLQKAVIDLLVELGDIDLAKVFLDWPSSAGLTNRQRLKIARHFWGGNRADPTVRRSLARSLEKETLRNREDALVKETSSQVIHFSYERREAAVNLRKRPSEQAAIALTCLNQEPVLQPV
jgi:transcriptional regulator with XRE-family HTH domain